MDTLTPNPDNCTHFEANPFKKEKCKHCGHPWTAHKGVISPETVAGYMSAKQKAEEDKLQKEADAKEKARAKALAKKKRNQSQDDEWLFDGKEQAAEGDSDDDLGFRMFSRDDLDSAPLEQPERVAFKPLKVVNLIDFDECDVAEDEPAPVVAGAGVSSGHGAAPGAADPTAAKLEASHGAAIASTPRQSIAGGVGGGMRTPDQVPMVRAQQDEELLTEIQHLRQMLADSNEEKSIQVAIVRDEVAEKQQLIEDLLRRRAETDAELSEARKELASSREKAAAREAEFEALQQKVQQLRGAMASQSGDAAVPSAGVAPAGMTQVVAATITELRDLCARSRRALEGSTGTGQEEEKAFAKAEEGGDLEAALLQLKKAAFAVVAAAEDQGADRRRIAADVRAALATAAGNRTATGAPPEPTKVPISEPQKAASRHAVQVLKEMRLNAAQQLAWLNERMLVANSPGNTAAAPA
mmetsp:Transcript_120285/g.256740  ORF Transcript_120285/g.256740 Transcript_120285/m.256740 type:complete len:469 (-) Transcript_120285:67-1473(-)